MEDADGEVVLFHQYWLLRRSLAEEEHSLSFTVPVSEPLPPQYFVRMMSDRWIGCEATLAVSFRWGAWASRLPGSARGSVEGSSLLAGAGSVEGTREAGLFVRPSFLVLITVLVLSKAYSCCMD